MKLIIIGSGGHAGVVADAAVRSEMFVIEKYLDETKGDKIIGHPNVLAFIAIGNNEVRERLSKRDFRWVNVIHPTALPCAGCIGSYFGANSVVGNNSKVGSFSIINTGVILEHDSVVGDYSHLCPGVVTGGRVKIGNRTTIGLSAVIRDGVTIGNNCVIGMGSVILKDIPDNSVWWGNPAKFQHENRSV
jgi:sugar O-acyltransferase (sialic acid O-acetyltransferase NeuD family)